MAAGTGDGIFLTSPVSHKQLLDVPFYLHRSPNRIDTVLRTDGSLFHRGDGTDFWQRVIEVALQHAVVVGHQDQVAQIGRAIVVA